MFELTNMREEGLIEKERGGGVRERERERGGGGERERVGVAGSGRSIFQRGKTLETFFFYVLLL